MEGLGQENQSCLDLGIFCTIANCARLCEWKGGLYARREKPLELILGPAAGSAFFRHMSLFATL
jgi:hypothetical protein